MAYRIDYNIIGKFPMNKKKNWTGVIAGILVVALIIGAITVKMAGLPWVREVLIPGDPVITAAALDGMVEDLRNGDSIIEAITAFCREIMKHAPQVE